MDLSILPNLTISISILLNYYPKHQELTGLSHSITTMDFFYDGFRSETGFTQPHEYNWVINWSLSKIPD